MAILKYRTKGGTFNSLTNTNITPTTVVQAPGDSTTSVMSQKAVVEYVNNHDTSAGQIKDTAAQNSDLATIMVEADMAASGSQAGEGSYGQDEINAAFSQVLNSKQAALTFNTAPSSSNKVATMADIPNVSGKENSSNKVTTWSGTPTDTNYPSEKLVKNSIDSIVNDTVASLRDEVTAILSRERVYVTIAVSSSGNIQDIANAQPTVYVRDRTNGDILWQHQVDCSQNGTDTISDGKIILPYFDLNAKFDYEIYASHITLYNAGGQTLSADQYIDPARIHKTVAFGDVVTGERSMLTYKHIDDVCDIIYIDDTINDPSQKITGDVGYKKVNGQWVANTETITDGSGTVIKTRGDVVRWIRENTHRYAMKYTGDSGSGTDKNISAALVQLHDSNTNKFANASDADMATDAPITTIGVDVMVRIPKFYYQYIPMKREGDSEYDPNYHCVKIWRGDNLIEGDGIRVWSGNYLIGAYEAVGNSGSLYSPSGYTSTGAWRVTDFLNAARNRGYLTMRRFGFEILRLEQHNIIGFLLMAIYGNTNSQYLCGSGTNSYSKVNGLSNLVGMKDSTPEDEFVNFLGFENIWGNKKEMLGDAYYYFNANGNYIRCYDDDDNPSNYRTIISIDSTNINTGIKKMIMGEHLDMIPTADGGSGSTSTGYCDFCEIKQVDTNRNVVCVGGYYNYNTGGMFCLASTAKEGNVDSPVGARLSFKAPANGLTIYDASDSDDLAAWHAIAPVTTPA